MIDFIYQGDSKKLSSAIAKSYPNITYNSIRKALRNKDILVNGLRTKDDIEVNNGDNIKAYINVADMTLDIRYVDDNILVVYKPKGIATDGDNSYNDIVASQYKNATPCHRLDTNTDGLLVYALNDNAYISIKDAIHLGTLSKYYLALVYGVIEGDNYHYKAYLKKYDSDSHVVVYDCPQKDTVEINTNFTVVQRGTITTLVEVHLVAGKTHQIRAHLAHIGYPVVGDTKYGSKESMRAFSYKRQLLTAYKLVFGEIKGLEYLKNKEISVESDLYSKIK